jgi:hypothetical protein
MIAAPRATGLAVSADQILLLRAALADGDEALEAWRTWQARTDLDGLDAESQRLLPLLYRNLGRLGVGERATARYASVYRQSWFKNSLAFRDAAHVIDAFSAAGIDTMVLKGAALALLHYRDVGARSMADVDILVSHRRLRDALALLEAEGWTVTFYRTRPAALDPAILSIHHATRFHDKRGRPFDLHWFASQDCLVPGGDDILWQAAVPLQVSGASTRALAPTDQLYHVCAHAYLSGGAHVRWVADAVTILRTSGDRIDWSRLAALADARRLVLPLQLALGFVRAEFGAAVPAAFLDALATRPISRLDRLEHAHNMSERPYTLGKVLLRHWCRHRRSTSSQGLMRVAAFPRFLCRTYRVHSPWRLPLLAVRRGVSRIRRSRRR